MPLNKPAYNMATTDIGANPQCVKFKSTRQANDPLNPTYNISTVEVRNPTPPRFTRDQMGIDDIDGTRSKRTWKGGDQPREVN